MKRRTEKNISPLNKRVWEIDALRGFLIFLVVGYHLYKTVDAFCINGYYNIDSIAYVNISDPLRFWFSIDAAGNISYAPFPAFSVEVLQPICVDIFFIVSGISCIFSRNNLKSGIRLLCGAAFVSIFTKLLALYTGDSDQFIRFGVLHCYALCHLIYYFLLENRSNKVLLISAAGSLVLGYTLRHLNLYSQSALLVPFGIREYGVSLRDYWPVFPMLGWFLIGVVMGRRWYAEKKTLFPNQEEKKWHRPLRFLGRNSGLIYCGHMVVYSIVFISIGHIFDLY